MLSLVQQNGYSNAVKKWCKDQVSLKFKVQSRQLRAFHSYSHEISPHFKYLCAFAGQFKDATTFLSIGNKAKIDRKTGLFTFKRCVRKKIIVSNNKFLQALDHDVNQKRQFFQSVYRKSRIPKDMKYSKQVSK